MYNGIDWLPAIIDKNDYRNIETNTIDYCKLIEDSYNYFYHSFLKPKNPVLFENKRITVAPKMLDCSSLKYQNCYNSEYYSCDNCKFKNYLDIFNHICTDNYDSYRKKNKKISVPKLKKSKNGKSIPRTPGKFNIDRITRTVWLRAIIEHCDDADNVKLNKSNRDVSFILVKEKYKIVIMPKYDKFTNTVKYYILKTAFYMGK